MYLYLLVIYSNFYINANSHSKILFSQQYLKKAGLIAGTFGEVHSDEVRTRQIFQEKLNRHFLASMFQVQ